MSRPESSGVFDRVDPAELAEREVLERLRHGPLTLDELQFDGSSKPGEAFAAANRLRKRGKITARKLDGGRFEFKFPDDRGQVHPIAIVGAVFVCLVLSIGMGIALGVPA